MNDEKCEAPVWPSSATDFACLRFARKVRISEDSLSKDVLSDRIDSLRRAAHDALTEHVGRAGSADESLLVGAIDYLADIHDGPWRGTPWFRHGLDVLLEAATPSGGLSDQGAAFLERLQRGAMSTVSEHVRSRADVPMSDHEAAEFKALETIARSSPVVVTLLDAIERFHYGEPLDGDDRLLRLAALCAPIARLARKGLTPAG